MATEAASMKRLPGDPEQPEAFDKREQVVSTAASPFGIKAKLFLAFCSLAGLTAAASAVAWYVFGDIDRSVTRLTAESFPGMVSVLGLAQKSSEIAATAPALMASPDKERRVLEQAGMSQRTADLAAAIEDLSARGIAPEVIDRLMDTRDELTVKLEALNGAIEQRLDLKVRREARLSQLSAIHAGFLEAIEPLVDDSVFDLVITGEQVTAEGTNAVTGLVEGGVGRIDRLLSINAEANLAAGMLAEAMHVRDQALIQPLRERFEAAAAAVQRDLRQLSDEATDQELRGTAADLLAFGLGERNVFDRRILELEQTSADAGGDEVWSSAADVKSEHERLLLLLTPLIDDAAFDLVLMTEGVTKRGRDSIRDLIDVGAYVLEALLTLRAEGNLAAGVLNQAAAALETSYLEPLHERFIAAEGQILRNLGNLPPALNTAEIRQAITALLDMGKADDGLFALRREELRHLAHAKSALDESRALTVRLGEEVETLIRAAQDDSQGAAAQSAQAIAGGKLFMVILTGAGILGAAVVMFYYVGPRIIRPLERITAAMVDLAGGDTSVDIPGRDRRDELGRMAQALGVFRDTAIEVQESNLREIGETRRRLSEAIESISEAFSLYDGDDRLVVCNAKYRSLLYPSMGDEITPGMTFEAIVRRAIELGLIEDARDDPEAWIARRLTQHRRPTGPHTQQRGDGRWVMVSERKTEDGGTVAVYSDITEMKQREQELADKSNALEQLSNQLAKYLSPQVYESIFTGRQEVKLASRRKKLTVFFSDIAGFTETADKLESEELTDLLNHYLTEMSRIALDHGATIDKYVGDAIVIFFGDPESRGIKEDALACVRMAIAMRERMCDLQVLWRDTGIEKPLECRIGINTGFCTVGNFGSEDRMDYTIIGGGVNLASRLESAATPGEILISYETYALVKDEIHCEEHGEVTVKGIAYPVATYQVVNSYANLGESPERIREDLPNLKLNADLDAMSDQERSEAIAALRRALDRIGDYGG
jgi:class 3 adenylate cyclase/phosphoglycerate-specific signal transduction histidine kinase